MYSHTALLVGPSFDARVSFARARLDSSIFVRCYYGLIGARTLSLHGVALSALPKE